MGDGIIFKIFFQRLVNLKEGDWRINLTKGNQGRKGLNLKTFPG